MRKQRTRKSDSPKTALGWLLTHAKDIIAVFVLAGMVSVGMSHFATAADVSKKFAAIKIELKIAVFEARKARIEDELFRLRSDTKKQGTDPQIQRYEAELRDVSARLRDLEKEVK